MSRIRIRMRLFAKKSKRMCLIVTWRELGQSPQGCHSALWKGRSALWKGRSALQKCRMALLDANHAFHVRVRFRLLLGFLEPSLALRRVFNPYSKIFISFLDNSSLFSNNYLIDKYSRINLDKVQIIHNYIIIQLSPLFPCKQSYFRH